VAQQHWPLTTSQQRSAAHLGHLPAVSLVDCGSWEVGLALVEANWDPWEHGLFFEVVWWHGPSWMGEWSQFELVQVQIVPTSYGKQG